MIDLDDWQIDVMETEGNIVLRSGRQVGKSTVISCKAAEYAANNPNKTVLVIASVERQAYLLFEKILSYMEYKYKTKIKGGKYRPTKQKMLLTNGSKIYCLPTGLTGHGIRGYTVDLLIADEAAFIPDMVWTAVTPMLAVTRGKIILLSTPFGKGGYFYRCFSDPNFTSFHISSEDCPRADHQFLAAEKERMSKLQYAQEYLGEFVDELRQFFSEESIKNTLCLKTASGMGDNKTYLGVDVARMGGDETVLFSLTERGRIYKQLHLGIATENRITDTVRMIKDADSRYKYKRIFIDDGGMGVGVFDTLLEDTQTKRKVEAINNSARSLDKTGQRRKKLLKEDLYNNLLAMMEQGRIQLCEDARIRRSLKSIQKEFTDDGRLKIFGRYSHITEALIRAAWAARTKNLNLFITYS